MKIVHLSYKDDQEGAAIAVDRLCEALNSSGFDSKILVQKRVSGKKYSELITNSNSGKLKSYLRVAFDLLINRALCTSSDVYFSFPFIGKNICNNILVKNSDVIHVHWVNRGFQSLNSLNKLIELGKPVIITLHDSWYLTGGCHMVGSCTQFKYDCANCPSVRSRWIPKYFLKRKKKIFFNENVHFTAPSTWSRSIALASSVTNKKLVHVIPNCIDTELFKPMSTVDSRALFSLSLEKHIVLVNVTNDPRKGVEYIKEAIRLMVGLRNDVIFVGFGAHSLEGGVFEGLPIQLVGRINDKYSMAMLYNAASVLLSPTLEEPFGQTFIESMSVGTPCVAFNHSGPVDIVSHKENGYLARFGDVEDIVTGLNYCLVENERLAVNSRNRVLDSFSYKVVSESLSKIYTSVCLDNEN
ncbi:glycosyltransferase [Vibrio sp. T187]|uniref:glycosyltransferase n=1 Tax=Vibrio TaxID=662 RepID=UPI0010CA01F5|nr:MULTISPECIES: glycosyltransferase [Vibrio]MBW3697567.1 glycosyltransferase [Vibrio sp. T187]